jgi:hypothetical protein
MAETCLHGPCTCPTDGGAFCSPACEELSGRGETEFCRCGHEGCAAEGSSSQDADGEPGAAEAV